MDGGLTSTLWHVYHLCALYLEMRPMLREAIDRYRTLARAYLQVAFR
jgi:hypothetical protein